jgi:hypothetical protein
MLNCFAFGAWGAGMPEPKAEGVDVAPVASVIDIACAASGGDQVANRHGQAVHPQ